MKENTTNESAQPIECDDQMEQTPVEVENTAESAKSKKGIKALINYIKSHEELRQMVMFFLFSLLCAASQTITQFVLKYAIGAANDAPFSWFLFDYPQEKGLAEFIGFVCGAVIGQVMTFVLNRKKTFKATNNVVIAGIMYAIIAIGIILLQTYLGAVITRSCTAAAVKNGTSTEGIIGLLITITGMAAGGLSALILSFLGNKYLVMRNWGKKKTTDENTETTEVVENAENEEVVENDDVANNADLAENEEVADEEEFADVAADIDADNE